MSRPVLIDRKTSCERWNLPDLGEPAGLSGNPGQAAADKKAESAKPGYEEGFASGRLEGLESGRQELVVQAQRLEQLMGSLQRPFDELDQEVEEGLVALTIAIVRKLVHVELNSSPELIASVVKQTVALLPGASRDIEVHLHPEDAHLLEDLLPGSAGEGKWRIVEDAALQRGGCVVKTRASQIDATVEARLENVIASLLNAGTGEDLAG